GDAPGRRCKAGAGEMHEDGAAPAGADRPAVVAYVDDAVIDVVVPPHPLVARGIRKAHRPVVEPIARGVAPAVVRAHPARRKAAARSPAPVGAQVEGTECEAPERGRAVALAFGARDTTLAERAGQHDMSCNEKP